MKKKLGSRILFFVLISVLVVSAFVLAPNFEKETAYATSIDSWGMDVAKYLDDTDPNFTDIYGGPIVDTSYKIAFLINNYVPANTYDFYESNTDLSSGGGNLNEKLANLESNQWSRMEAGNIKESNSQYYYPHIFSKAVDYKKYIYFRCTVSDNGINSYYYYKKGWLLDYQVDVGVETLGIDSIRAIYYNDANKPIVYTIEAGMSTPKWIGYDLIFTITTKRMADKLTNVFEPNKEKLSYSLDSGASWIPLASNTLVLSESYYGNIIFRVTNHDNEENIDAGENKSRKEFEHIIKLDKAIPEFSMEAKTKDIDGNIVNYTDGDWSGSDVVITLIDPTNKVSDINYYVSINGAEFQLLSSKTYSMDESYENIRFRAVNGAGGEKTYSFNVNIDKVKPNAQVEVYHLNPSNEGQRVEVAFNADDNTYYANSEANVRLFNKKDGVLIENSSPLSYYYIIADKDGNYLEDKAVKIKGMNSLIDGTPYAYFDERVGKEIHTTIKYRFYIVSSAGIKSDFVDASVCVVNNSFDVELQEVKDEKNENGWSSEMVPVYLKVSTDSKIVDGNVTVPTTKYTVRYEPKDQVSGIEAKTTDLVYDPTYEVKDLSEGYSIYRFYIDTSANSVFNFIVINSAGKESEVIESGKKITIDTQEIDVDVVAYVKPEDNKYTGELAYLESGDWANGRIIVQLIVTKGINDKRVYGLDYNGSEWQQGEMIYSSSVTEDGLQLIFQVEIGLDSDSETMSKLYKYRVVSASGRYKDVEYLANIDISDIFLNKVVVGEKEYTFVGAGGGNVVTVDPISSNTSFDLISNDGQIGHFGYIQKYTNNTTQKFDTSIFNINVNDNQKGEIVMEFYLYSKAIDYLGNSKTSSTADGTLYKIIIPFNTLHISLQIESYVVNNSGVPLPDQDDEKWTTGAVGVQVKLLNGQNNQVLSDEDRANYTYYYQLINSQGVVVTDWVEGVGTYDEVTKIYSFTINFDQDSFYGEIALTIKNEANYSPVGNYVINREFRIDNTTPDLEEIITNYSGEKDGNKYYSNSSIDLEPVVDINRSPIKFYYFIKTAENPTPQDGLWEELLDTLTLSCSKNASMLIHTVYTVYLKAENGLGVTASETEYIFELDPIVLTGSLGYNRNSGAYDEQRQIYAYKWEDMAEIYLDVVTSNTDLKFFFSVDSGEYWIDYNIVDGDIWIDASQKRAVLTFNTSYFEELFEEFYSLGQTDIAEKFAGGVMYTFSFKVENMAGSSYIYDTNIYIAMDSSFPDFELEVKKSTGEVYTGDRAVDSFAWNNAVWSSVPVNISIIYNNYNISGVRFEYKITFKNGDTTAPLVLPSDSKFSSDKLVGFNRNNDAWLTIIGYNKADYSKGGTPEIFTQRSVRLSIDQIKPVFSLNGQSYNEESSSESIILNSGKWTNYDTVSVSKSLVNNNVSNVTYKVYESNETTPEGEPSFYPASGSIIKKSNCKLRVVAITEAGLIDEQVFYVNIDTIKPNILFQEGLEPYSGEKIYMDLRVRVEEENIKTCQYITKIGDTKGFPLAEDGFTLSTSSVDNSILVHPETGEEYRGYVRIFVEDMAGNTSEIEFFVLPFRLTVNNITLSNNDKVALETFEEDFSKARVYMDSERIDYFETTIAKLYERIETVTSEIDGYKAYLISISTQEAFQLNSDFDIMFNYLETFENYEAMGQGWIQDEILQGEFITHYETLWQKYKELEVLMNEVYQTEMYARNLPAINVVVAEDYEKIINVVSAYNDLTNAQKTCFTTTLYTKMLELKKICEVLLLSDKTTGVKLSGDKIAPGAQVDVMSYDNTTESFSNAERALFSKLTAEDPRAVVSIFRIALKGATSQTKVEDMIVTLPIKEEYRKYKQFGVYQLSSDGAIIKVEGVTIAEDGKSVSFESDELATFILSARAAVEVDKGQDDSFGTFLGMTLTVELIRTMAIIAISVFGVLIIIIIFASLRNTRFLNSYNKTYRKSRYRRGVEKIPKGNTIPTQNPNSEEPERLKDNPTHYQ